MNENKKERLIELLTDSTLFGLDAADALELVQLKKQFPEWENDFSLELAAAAINLHDLDASQELPADVRARILTAAADFFDKSEKAPNVVSFPVQATERANAPVGRRFENASEVKQPFWQWLGWGVAALACVALAVNLWFSRSRPPTEIVKTPETVQTPTPEPSAAQQREQLLATATDAVRTSWTAPKDEKEILGDVVWSGERQTGYMRFRGLPANDPNRESYQLWIVDEAQNPKTPVSGGVFDVGENGEVIIPINAQIRVKKPKVFAVTKEKAGGVVVSTQKEFVAVAKI